MRDDRGPEDPEAGDGDRNKLIEAITIRRLRACGVDAQPAPMPIVHRVKRPDILIGPPHDREVEVSWLHLPETWDQAHRLRADLEGGLLRVMAEAARSAFVAVELEGMPSDLAGLIPDVVAAFRVQIMNGDCKDKRLVPGFSVTVKVGASTVVTVAGSTVIALAGTTRRQRLTRIHRKALTESKQVGDGGVVFLWTHQLFLLANGGDPDIYAAVVDDLRNIGAKKLHVAAFGVMEVIRASSLPPARLPTGTPCAVAEHPEGTWQRVFWIPNPSATRPLPAEAVSWFTPPFDVDELLRP